MSTIETVQHIYEAFGRGDVGAILEHIDAGVEWEYGSVDNGVPWLARRRGPDGVIAFFQTIAETLEFRDFAVNELLGNERTAIALVRLEARVKATGKTIREEAEPHVWHFGTNGKVVKFRHAADTFGHVQACAK